MPSNTAQPLNVLHVLSDQHLATCLGAEGHSQAITPNMDRLAAMGTRFTHAYTQNPICTPSRVSMLSGQYCHNHGYFGLSGPTPPGLSNYLRHFKQAGYRTAAIGKLHMPNDPEDWILHDCDLYGESYTYRKQGRSSPFFDHLEAAGLRDKEDSIALPEFDGAQQHEGRPSELPYENSVEGWCVRQAIPFIDQCKADGKPFCMQVSLPRPHQCYTPDQRFWDMYDDDLALPPTIDQDPSLRPPHFRRTFEHYQNAQGLIEPKGRENVARRVWRAYLACITQVDFALGELMDHLEATGQLENTVVIYNSDHGAYSNTHGIPEKAPGICSEAVCRVPFIWHAPGVTSPGTVSEHLVENIDIAPTIASLCGLPEMDWVDGKDITALLRGDDTPVRDVAVTEHPWSKAIRWDNWRLVHYQRGMFGGENVGELYDIAADPDETTNLFYDDAHQSIVNEGRRCLLEWLIRTTRIVTAWPPPKWQDGIKYPIACDGKQANGAGAQGLHDNGQLNYL